MSDIIKIAILLITCSLVSGCGIKGNLQLPDEEDSDNIGISK